MTQLVKQLRVVVNTEDFELALAYYRDALGLNELAAFAGDGDARVVIMDAGRATLELANTSQARFIAQVETGGIPSSTVRLAFEVDDTAEVSDRLASAGAEVIAAPVLTPWNSLNARFAGPANIQVTLFQELDGRYSIGADLSDFGGEGGELARLVRLAADIGATGALPFAANVVRNGVLIGEGINRALADSDPSAHAEVVAIRDAARRVGSLDLTRNDGLFQLRAVRDLPDGCGRERRG